jgi:hypothetical protein
MIYIGNKRKGSVIPVGMQMSIDRATSIGNPFEMGTDESKRNLVCDQYEQWFKDEVLTQKNASAWSYLCSLLSLAMDRDIVLMCWCAPKRCHGETIKRWLDEKLANMKK